MIFADGPELREQIIERHGHFHGLLHWAQRLFLKRLRTAVPHVDLAIGEIENRRRSAGEPLHQVANTCGLSISPGIARAVAGRARQQLAARKTRVEIELFSKNILLNRVRVVGRERNCRGPLVGRAHFGVGYTPSDRKVDSADSAHDRVGIAGYVGGGEERRCDRNQAKGHAGHFWTAEGGA